MNSKITLLLVLFFIVNVYAEEEIYSSNDKFDELVMTSTAYSESVPTPTSTESIPIQTEIPINEDEDEGPMKEVTYTFPHNDYAYNFFSGVTTIPADVDDIYVTCQWTEGLFATQLESPKYKCDYGMNCFTLKNKFHYLDPILTNNYDCNFYTRRYNDPIPTESESISITKLCLPTIFTYTSTKTSTLSISTSRIIDQEQPNLETIYSSIIASLVTSTSVDTFTVCTSSYTKSEPTVTTIAPKPKPYNRNGYDDILDEKTVLFPNINQSLAKSRTVMLPTEPIVEYAVRCQTTFSTSLTIKRLPTPTPKTIPDPNHVPSQSSKIIPDSSSKTLPNSNSSLKTLPNPNPNPKTLPNPNPNPNPKTLPDSNPNLKTLPNSNPSPKTLPVSNKLSITTTRTKILPSSNFNNKKRDYLPVVPSTKTIPNDPINSSNSSNSGNSSGSISLSSKSVITSISRPITVYVDQYDNEDDENYYCENENYGLGLYTKVNMSRRQLMFSATLYDCYVYTYKTNDPIPTCTESYENLCRPTQDLITTVTTDSLFSYGTITTNGDYITENKYWVVSTYEIIKATQYCKSSDDYPTVTTPSNAIPTTEINSIPVTETTTETETIPTTITEINTTTPVVITPSPKCLPNIVTVTENENVTVTEKETVTVTVNATNDDNNDQKNSNCAPKWAQCGGQGFKGPTCCQSGSTCRRYDQYYSQCI